jgi:hypothetical protein
VFLEVAEEASGGRFIGGDELVDEEEAHFFVTVRGSQFSFLGSRFERETVGTTNFTEGTNEGEEGPFFAKALKGSLRKRILFWQWDRFVPGGLPLVVVSGLGEEKFFIGHLVDETVFLSDAS